MRSVTLVTALLVLLCLYLSVVCVHGSDSDELTSNSLNQLQPRAVLARKLAHSTNRPTKKNKKLPKFPGPVLTPSAEGTSVTTKIHIDPLYQTNKKPDLNGPVPTFLKCLNKQLGIPYLFGGTTRKGFDCSGLTQYCAFQAGLKDFPRVSGSIAKYGKDVGLRNLKPGDILYFGKPTIHHVATYAGNGKMIEAQQTGTLIMVSAFDPKRRSYLGARRIFPDTPANFPGPDALGVDPFAELTGPISKKKK
jgi:cell wall-associated NlpC family hydrolase